MIELSLSKQQLLTPLLMVAAAVDKKQSLPILGNILIQSQENKLCLTATDLEIEITATIECPGLTAFPSVTVPAKKICDIIRSLEDEAVPVLRFHEDKVTIVEGRSQFKLAVLPAIGFPSCATEHNEMELYIDRVAFMKLLQSTHFAMSQQDVRLFLNGVLLSFDAQYITAVATDGHRMAVSRLSSSTAEMNRLLVPRKGVQEILRLLGIIQDERILVNAGKNHIRIMTEQYTLVSKLIDTRFPNYTNAIPTQQDKCVFVDRDRLKRSLVRMSILANEKSKAILLQVQPQQITLIANNQEKEEATEVLEVRTEGGEISIGLNASYLLEGLNHLAEGDIVLSFSNPESSILVEAAADEYSDYVLMPIKL